MSDIPPIKDETPRIVSATPEAVMKAAGYIRDGRLVAFPTETVYGLGADATNDHAVAAIFAAKGRPSFNPLIVHVADALSAARYAEMNDWAITLSRRFWPGPLTLVLKRKPDCPLSPLVSAGMDTVALRLPQSAIARELIMAAERPIAAPSANRSGRISPTMAAHVAESLALGDAADEVAMVLDNGPAHVGLESTVIDLSGDVPRLLRPGVISIEGLSVHLRCRVERAAPVESTQDILSPGQLSSHYAPRHKLRLNALSAYPGEALLGFGGATATADLNLSEQGNLIEAAANLFAMLHALDRRDIKGIAVAPIPGQGLGEAINDRLKRAAAPRPDNAPNDPADNVANNAATNSVTP